MTTEMDQPQLRLLSRLKW